MGKSAWTEEDSEKMAKALIEEAGRSEWSFEAIKERLEEEPYFEQLRAESDGGDAEETDLYDEKLNDVAMEVEACMDWPEGDWVVGEH